MGIPTAIKWDSEQRRDAGRIIAIDRFEEARRHPLHQVRPERDLPTDQRQETQPLTVNPLRGLRVNCSGGDVEDGGIHDQRCREHGGKIRGRVRENHERSSGKKPAVIKSLTSSYVREKMITLFDVIQ